nr:ribonuclease H-like domain-containing protein [Tanacetum cinerariifolium]
MEIDMDFENSRLYTPYVKEGVSSIATRLDFMTVFIGWDLYGSDVHPPLFGPIRVNIFGVLGESSFLLLEYSVSAGKSSFLLVFISAGALLLLAGNRAKSMTTDNDGNLKIRPPVTAEEHQQVQREEKARTFLLSALPDEHMGDFYHMIDASDIWNAIKARFGGNAKSKKMQKSLLKQKFKEFKISEEKGLDKGYNKMQKILTQMNTLKIKPDPEDVNMKFLRGLPPSWYGIALILKTKGGLEYISFDDLYNKLKFLEIDTKGYSLSSSTLSNAAFVSTVGSSQCNLSYQESRNGGYTTSPGSSSSKGSLKSKCSVVDDMIYSFFANHEIDQHLVYKDLDQMKKEDFEEYDLKHQMAMLSIKVHRFEKKHRRKIKFNGRENARFDKKLLKCFNCKQMGHFSRECRAQGGQNSNNYQKYKYKEARKDGSDSKAIVVVDGSIDWDKQTEGGNTEPRSLENFGMIAGIKIESDADSKGEVVSADDVIPAGVSVSAGTVAVVVSPQSETEFALMSLSTKNQLAYDEKIKVLSYELEEKSNILEYRQKLINQAAQEKQELMTKLENEIANQAKWNNSGELGIDDSKFSIFHANSDELEGQPIYNRTKAIDSSEIKTNDDSISHSNDYVLFDFSDSYLHLIKDYDLHEQRFAKSNAEGNGILGRRPTGKPVNLNRPKLVSAGQPKPVSAGQQKPVSADPLNPVSAGQQNPVSAGPPNPVSAKQQNTVSAGPPNLISAGDRILGP